MPFTFAHPAIVLPLSYLPKRMVSMTGLIIGSMTPDFEYFLRMKIQSIYSHTLPGIFYFCLPIGLFVSFLFHRFIRQALVNNLPRIIGNRVHSIPTINWIPYFKTNYLIILVSLFIGASSHILWDGFTHPHGFFVERIPYLTTNLQVRTHDIKVYKILQHGSTLIGLSILLLAIFKLPSKPITGKISLSYWVLVVGITVFLTAIRFLVGVPFNLSGLGTLVATLIMTGFVSVILAPLILKQRTLFN